MSLSPTLLLVSSMYDPAGTLIHSIILESRYASLFSHLVVSKRLVEIDDNFENWMNKGISCVIFLSRHSGKGGVPTLTVHATGNYGSADLGGESQTLSWTDPHFMHAVFTELLLKVPKGYTVSYEVTHHGPTSLALPSFFVEIGSTEIEWHDKHAAQAVAEAVIEVAKRSRHVYESKTSIPLIGFGGSHYAARQTEISSISRGAFGHMMPSRQMMYLTDEMFVQMLEKSHAQGVYIDKKSLSNSEISTVTGFAAAHDVPVVSQTELINLEGASFSVYRKALSLVSDMFPEITVFAHPHHIEDLIHPVPVTLSLDLVLEAQKVDQKADQKVDKKANQDGTLKDTQDTFLDTISCIPCIHFSGNGIAVLNTFIVDQSCIAKRTDELIQACIRTICTAYNCTYQDNVLTIHKQRFNPAKAQSFDISPGPAYGKLMSGQSVMQDGREIHPDMVMDDEEYTIVVSSDTHMEKS